MKLSLEFDASSSFRLTWMGLTVIRWFFQNGNVPKPVRNSFPFGMNPDFVRRGPHGAVAVFLAEPMQ